MNANQVKPFPYTTNPDQIPSAKILDITPDAGRPESVNYACPDACWSQHLAAWRHELSSGNKSAPQPMPYRHCMFENPESYGCVRYGDASPESRRKAFYSHVRGMLAGWIDDAPEEARERIITATVEAKMKGIETGASPFVAALMAA